MKRALHVPAEELLGRGGRAGGGRRQRTLQQVVALLEVLARVNRQRARHPQVVERMLHGAPVPPPALAPGSVAVEVAVAHGPVGRDRGPDAFEHAHVPSQPVGPAGVADPVVEHGAAPPRQHRGRDETRGVRPVLEEQATAIDQAVERGPVVGAEAAPHREVVRTVQDVDRVELDAADVLREPDQASRRERRRARSQQMLPLEKEPGDGGRRERSG
jgi:hypothetical protein